MLCAWKCAGQKPLPAVRLSFTGMKRREAGKLSSGPIPCFTKEYLSWKEGQDFDLEVSGAFVYIGSTPNLFDLDTLELDGNYIKVDSTMKTSLERIYAVGDVIKKDIYQLANAASEGMVAAINIIKRLNKE